FPLPLCVEGGRYDRSSRRHRTPSGPAPHRIHSRWTIGLHGRAQPSLNEAGREDHRRTGARGSAGPYALRSLGLEVATAARHLLPGLSYGPAGQGGRAMTIDAPARPKLSPPRFTWQDAAEVTP